MQLPSAWGVVRGEPSQEEDDHVTSDLIVAAAVMGVMAVCKPVPMLALLTVAALLPTDGPRWTVMVALVLGLLGDILLLDPPSGRPPYPWALPLGIVAFLAGHVTYVAAVVQSPQAAGPFPWAGVVAVSAAALVGWHQGPRLVRAAGELGLAVVGYQVVILTLAVAAWTRGGWMVALGATFFVLSDLVLARAMFLARTRWSPPLVMVTYHLAQLLLTIGLLLP
jgi:uncharacterized membrane protein YhhN